MNDDLDETETEEMLTTLGDDSCRRILDALIVSDEAATVSEMSERLDIPESTLYRKLDRLVKTPLVTDTSTVSTDGHPKTRYATQVSEIVVDLSDGLTVDAVLEESVDAQLG